MSKIEKILEKYEGNKIIDYSKLSFSGVGDNDVYNISKPFKYNDKTYLLGRVEPRENHNSRVFLFVKGKNKSSWYADKNFNPLELEDPFIQEIRGLFVIGGVETKKKEDGELAYRTNFYKGKDIYNLEKFAHGPWQMKDIRLTELPDHRIGVFTRPEVGKGSEKGEIGFTSINSLEELNSDVIENASLIHNEFGKKGKGGVNDAFIIDKEKLGVLGHLVRRTDDGNLHYYPMVFDFNPETKESSELQILFKRDILPESEPKRPELYDVIFPGGIVTEGRNARVYAGVGDTEAYEVTIKNPFKNYKAK